jgi:hypothetical protein
MFVCLLTHFLLSTLRLTDIKDFPPFGETDFEMRVDPRITTVREFLSGITSLEAKLRRHGQCIRDLPEESVIDGEVEGFEVRLIKLHDVSYRDKSSYKKATRSKKVEKLGADKMAAAEPPMGRDIENYLMAVRMSLGEAPPIPKHRATTEKPEGSDNRKHWYRDMRRDACRTFWVKTTREQRDGVRARAKAPDPAFVPLIEQIQDEDKSHTKDPFWPYQRDEIAAEDANIYEPIDKDILIVLDKDNELLVCCFKRLFQFLFCQYKVNKLEDALRKWSSLPPLPLPETNRHMIDDFIRDTKHPEMDLERATSLEEIEQRQQCVVHYGTWAMKGHRNPDMVWKTVDTKLQRATPAKVQEDIVSPLMPTFTEDVLGLGSEPIRFLLSSMAPDEYRDNCDVFQALPENVKMKMSEPTFASLAVLGINTYTARHSDTNDVTFGLAGLLALGNYCGMSASGSSSFSRYLQYCCASQ